MTGQTVLRRIDAFHLVTPDPHRLAMFYRNALGFRVLGPPAPIPADELRLLGLAGGGDRVTLRLGAHLLHLDRFERPGRPYPADATAAAPLFQHLALAVATMNVAFRELRAVTPISRGGPQILPRSSGGVAAFKFRDPDGHPLELLEFPDALTPPAWRGVAPHPRTGLLGIDHSAIGVADTQAARDFYAPLGLRAEEGSRNAGPEQERLDGLDGVRVAVTPLRPPAGTAHLELLGYGRPAPVASARAVNDVAATRIAWAGDRDALLRDPDGHLHQVSASA